MGKATKVGKFRASSRDVKGAPLTARYSAQRQKKAADDGTEHAPPIEKEALSRGQRKRLAKRAQYLKRDKMIMSSLRLQRLEEQKGRLDGLDALREALGAIPDPDPKAIASVPEETATTPCNTNKSKKKLANAEITHMGLVLQHPSFKDDPFAAIQQHLRNSLAPEAAKMEEKSQKQAEEDGRAEAKKREERKERVRQAKFSKKKSRGRTNFKSNRAGRI